MLTRNYDSIDDLVEAVLAHVPEPTENDLNDESLVVDVSGWNFVRCRTCRKSFNMLKAHGDGDGNLICTYCGSVN